MKIFILSSEMLQIGMAGANRTKAYAKGLSLAGNEVQILSPFGFPNKVSAQILKEEIFEGGAKYTFLSYLAKHPREDRNMVSASLIFFIAKLLGYLKLYTTLLFKRSKYDIVFVYEFPIIHSLLIRIFSAGKPLMFELCEIPFPLEEPNQLLKRRLREYLNYYWATGFIAISDNLHFYANNLRRKFAMVRVPILVDDKRSDEEETQHHIESPSIVHIGTLHPTKDFILYVMEAYGMAMQQLPEELKFHFYLTGNLENAPDRKEIASVIEKHGIGEWVHFIGYQKENTLNSLISKCNLAVVYKENNEINHFGFPTKIGAYLKAGVPVIITPVGEMQKHIRDAYNGFIVNIGNKEELSKTLFEFFQNKEAYASMSANALHTAEHEFGLRRQGERISAFFQEILTK